MVRLIYPLCFIYLIYYVHLATKNTLLLNYLKKNRNINCFSIVIICSVNKTQLFSLR